MLYAILPTRFGIRRGPRCGAPFPEGEVDPARGGGRAALTFRPRHRRLAPCQRPPLDEPTRLFSKGHRLRAPDGSQVTLRTSRPDVRSGIPVGTQHIISKVSSTSSRSESISGRGGLAGTPEWPGRSALSCLASSFHMRALQRPRVGPALRQPAVDEMTPVAIRLRSHSSIAHSGVQLARPTAMPAVSEAGM